MLYKSLRKKHFPANLTITKNCNRLLQFFDKVITS